ncbi:MAG: YggS family pyridoxal phosphate-dependent enzyme [Dehalococcoidia bacterium]|nr:YggS family pyridoxal phosphate-dependent enzyme [Dehalococcoidia bacterium]
MGENTPARDPKTTAIGRNLAAIQKRIAGAAEKAGRSPSEITLVAVIKTVDAPAIREAFAAGLRHFGESRIQEAREKLPQLSDLQPAPTWHMVGHLQSNKAKTAAELFSVIHSVDSIKVAEALSQHANRDLSVLVQVNVAGEAGKFGLTLQDTIAALEHIACLPHLRTKGLMTIAPYTDDPDEVRPVFRRLRLMRDSLGLEHLSMGMSHDFEVAIEEGATMVRIGQAIFGERGVVP